MSLAHPDHLAWPHQLRRRFRLVVLDWDGTAVVDRQTPVPCLAERIDRLLGYGVTVVVVTGTKLESVLRQLTQFVPGAVRPGLYVCTNRGSEVWTFSGLGQPVLQYRYEASSAENQSLDRIALHCHESLAKRGLVTQIISDRLNRRKIDLVPVAEWREPRKSQVLELSAAVEDRLRRSGILGGIPEVLSLARDSAIQCDFPAVKITSDLKHIEIGLTDKSDSVRWIVENVFRSKGLGVENVAVFGDEFGSVGGVKGSDALMLIPELADAVFCSVGGEPGGVPNGVLKLGGGPARFLDFLGYQNEIWNLGQGLFDGTHVPTANPSWLIEQEGFDPSREHEMESLFAIGNGYIGVRGSTDLSIPSSQAEFYLAGIYDRKAVGSAYSESEFQADEGRPDPFSEIVPFPSPFHLKLRIDGVELTPGLSTGPIQMSGHERILDLKKGIIFEVFYFEDSRGGRISLRSFRLASLVDPHLLLQELEVQVEGRSVDLELEASPLATDFSLRYPHLHSLSKEMGPANIELSLFETSTSRFQCFIASQRIVGGVEQRTAIGHARVEPGNPISVRTSVSIFSSRDEDTAPATARSHLMNIPSTAFDQEIFKHSEEWQGFWGKADTRFADKPAVTQAHRFGLYQLRSAAPRSGATSVGARGLTGRSYEGHIFWDAEVFMFPFFLFAVPDAARNILLYRHRILPAARMRAVELGYRGASYAWESTVDGKDVTPSVIILLQSKTRVPIFTGREQIHVTADIAYAVCQYWDSTGDEAFMRDFGAEILAETARFWASRVTEKEGSFHILGVVGPDEYHHGVDDNAYTNWMARLNLERSAACMEWMSARYPEKHRELMVRVDLPAKEVQDWKEIARRIYFPRPNQAGVIEQFAGFFGLGEGKIGEQERLRAPVGRLLNWEEVNRLRVIKQADVLMIPFLFPDAWPQEMVEANFRYYAPLTDHGSSLSPCVHAAIAARIGMKTEADRFWDESLNLDLQNLMQNTPLGIHLGCIGGTWQALVFHFLGLRQKDGRLFREIAERPIHFPAGSHGVSLSGFRKEKGTVGASAPAATKGAA